MNDTNKKLLLSCVGFDWDDENIDKNWIKHKVTPTECEQIFFNHPLIIHGDIKHSKNENRYYSLGQTNSKRLLFIAFTIRKNLIRIISAKDMHKKERRVYEKTNTEI